MVDVCSAVSRWNRRNIFQSDCFFAPLSLRQRKWKSFLCRGRERPLPWWKEKRNSPESRVGNPLPCHRKKCTEYAAAENGRSEVLRDERPRSSNRGIVCHATVPSVKLLSRISARSKRVSLRITRDGTVVLTRPKRISERSALLFLEKKKRWVMHHVEQIQQQKASSPFFQWRDGGIIPLFDEQLTISVVPLRGRSKIHRIGSVLHVSAHPEDHDRIRLIVEQWYRIQADVYFQKTCTDLCHLLQLSFRRISIKGQTSRWGSCSGQGNLNFNWKLMMAPEYVAFAVAVHECCHLQHLNHSRAFWSLVHRVCPDYERAARWLRAHGGILA